MIMEQKKEKIIIALKKSRSSLDKILLAMEDMDEAQCFDLVQQNLAVVGLLKSANAMMLENHLDAYIKTIKNKTAGEKKKLQEVRDEMMRIIKTAQNK